MPTSKEKASAGIIPFINLVGRQKNWLLLAVLATAVTSLLILAFNNQLRQLIDTMLAGESEILQSTLISFLVIALSMTVAFFLERFSAGWLAEKTIARLRLQLAKKINETSVNELQKKHSGEFISRMTTDLELIREYLNQHLTNSIFVPMMALLALVYIFLISPSLTLVSVAAIPILGYISGRLGMAMNRESKNFQEQLGAVNTLAQDSLSGIEVNRAFGLEKTMLEKFSQQVDKARIRGITLGRKKSFLTAVAILANITPFLICIVYGGFLIINNQITVGAFLAFVNLLNFLANPMEQIPQLLGHTQTTLAAVKRVDEVLSLPSEPSGSNTFADNAQSFLNFEDVTFGYEEEPILSDLNFSVNQGEKIALVGPSGAGKTTILKLIAGFYKPQKGTVRILGHPLDSWDLKNLRENLAVVTQEPYLFPGSIADNIGYGKPGATQKEIVQAAQTANAHHFISQLPKGYDTPVGELGSRFSGGQKQRITMARALLREAALLLLDEPTSSLDGESETKVQKALEQVTHNRTSIIIAHRLSTIQNADRILVISGGKVIESGTHHELLQRKGPYYHLYQTQFRAEEKTQAG